MLERGNQLGRPVRRIQHLYVWRRTWRRTVEAHKAGAGLVDHNAYHIYPASGTNRIVRTVSVITVTVTGRNKLKYAVGNNVQAKRLASRFGVSRRRNEAGSRRYDRLQVNRLGEGEER